MQQNKEIYMNKKHVLPIDNAGLYVKADSQDGSAEFLPMKEINVDAKICDSMATVKITQVYVNPSTVDP
jgi:hypothetical protein